ncbi:MAG: peptidylprolyl isomerase [Bacilli bacterium]|nr:peptidylprolyl isomerase [Bacilli bacterium]
MKKKLFLITLSLFLLCGCGKVPKLKNGEEAVITFKDGEKISADELYSTLKKDYALEATVNLIDKKILEKEFKSDVKDAKKYAEDNIKSMKETYGSEEELLQAIQYYTNYSTIEAYQEYIYINYLQNKAAEAYAAEQVSKDEVKNYYNNVYFGDVKISHILITPKVKQGASQDEINKAENEALNKANEVIAKLTEAKSSGKDVAKTFKELAKEYSDDDSTKKDGGSLGYINLNSLGSNYDELVNAAAKMKNKTFSTEVITTDLGYQIIYKADQKEKASLEKAEKDIRTILGKSKLASDQTITFKAMKHYRDEYKTEIVDKDIKEQYSRYMNNMLNQDKKQNTKSSK